MSQAKGIFEVKRTPQSNLDVGNDIEIGHFRFDKTFAGPLTATSVVQMLAVHTATEGSAAYVAIEHISGSLDGRIGTFFTQHNGIMNRGTPSLSLTVVPDSATDELTGLSGQMTIDIVDGKHYYLFEYTLLPHQ